VKNTVLSAFLSLRNDLMNDEYFMSLALKEAEAAFDEGEVPVGAVLVMDNEVLAATHNRKEEHNDPTSHAELNIIREGALKTGDWRLTDATLYVTKEPCVMCAGAMINARLGRLVYGCRDERFGAVTSRLQLVNDPGLNHEVRVLAGVLEDKCAEILSRFFKMRRGNS
jgi:tRNA(adenine34) deaminase